MLVLEVEFLTGVSVSSPPNRRNEAEWPPHPDRLFQALAAAWGRNINPEEDERAALEWLEALDSAELLVSAPIAHRRDVGTVYVPPNDARTTGAAGDRPPGNPAAAARVIPEFRKNRQPRAFPAVIPAGDRPTLRYIWPTAEGLDLHRAALERLAAEVTYLGHSQSLVRVAITASDSGEVDEAWLGQRARSLRVPHRRRLQYLEDQYRSADRPNPSLVEYRVTPSRHPLPPATIFEPENVTVFADAGGFVPSLVAFPLVAKRVRDALLDLAPKGIPVSALLSGHDADRRPTMQPHIAIVPLADVGWTHSQGRLMGLALVWPREARDEERRTSLNAVATFLREGNSKVGLLHFGHDGSWSLEIEPESDRASLRFARYIGPARSWGTVLPAALDRHPKARPGEDIASIVIGACRNVGLPDMAMDGLDIEVHKHAPVRGAPSAPDVWKSLAEDSPYRSKSLVHLVLTFARPIRGPLILGAGRFRGLGLCLPLNREKLS